MISKHNYYKVSKLGHLCSRMSQVVTLTLSYFILQGALLVQCVSGKDINSKPNIVILLADDVSRFVNLCVAS